MRKGKLKHLLILLIAVFAFSCFAGCGMAKDVYGAASDYIKVSHPDKPNTNVFSDESADDKDSDKTSSDKQGSNDASSKAADSSGSGTSSKKGEKGDKADNSSAGENQSGEDETGNSGDTIGDEVDGDYGPVVTF